RHRRRRPRDLPRGLAAQGRHAGDRGGGVRAPAPPRHRPRRAGARRGAVGRASRVRRGRRRGTCAGRRGGTMSARTWRGETAAAPADADVASPEQTGLAAYRSTPGNRGAHLLRRELGGSTEFVTLTFWDDLDAVRRFAGDDVTVAVFYPEDDRFLTARDLRAH